MQKERLGLDLDEVLADIINPLVIYFNEYYKTNFKRNQLVKYHLEETWNIKTSECNERVHEFYASEEFKKIKPIRGAIKGVDYLSKTKELHIITARPDETIEETNRWINEVFPGKFAGIHFGNHYSIKERIPKKKSEICKELKITKIMEDTLHNAMDCANNGIEVLLLNQPWNKSEINHEKIKRVYSWKEAVNYA